jgi:hypothetical protein
MFKNERLRDTLPALICYFNDELDAVFERPAILVCTAVGRWGEELREKVSMGTVQLDTIIASFFEKLRCVRKNWSMIVAISDSVAACGLVNVLPIILPVALNSHCGDVVVEAQDNLFSKAIHFYNNASYSGVSGKMKLQ